MKSAFRSAIIVTTTKKPFLARLQFGSKEMWLSVEWMIKQFPLLTLTLDAQVPAWPPPYLFYLGLTSLFLLSNSIISLLLKIFYFVQILFSFLYGLHFIWGFFFQIFFKIVMKAICNIPCKDSPQSMELESRRTGGHPDIMSTNILVIDFMRTMYCFGH